MTLNFLCKLPIIRDFIDERYHVYRRRALGFGGAAGALSGIAVFEYRIFADKIVNWDLMIAPTVMLAVTLTLMVWYFFRK